jgi:hypothetical protein
MTNEEIKEIQREIRETQARLTVLQGIVANLNPQPEGLPLIPEPWKRWEPAKGELFYVVHGDMNIMELQGDRRKPWGNYIPFRTQVLAERHAKRLRSMVPTCAMPKDGDVFWMVAIFDKKYDTTSLCWNGSQGQYDLYHSGQVFLTKAAAEAWIVEFGDVWTSRVEGEGE